MSGPESSQFVIFRVGAEEFGLPIAQVSSIIRHEIATPVPRAPEMVEGVINLRGRVVPVVSLSRRLFGIDPVVTNATRIVIAESSTGPVGLVVDAARGADTGAAFGCGASFGRRAFTTAVLAVGALLLAMIAAEAFVVLGMVTSSEG